MVTKLRLRQLRCRHQQQHSAMPLWGYDRQVKLIAPVTSAPSVPSVSGSSRTLDTSIPPVSVGYAYCRLVIDRRLQSVPSVP